MAFQEVVVQLTTQVNRCDSVKTSSFACLHAGSSPSLRGSSAGVSYALLFWASATQTPCGHADARACWAQDKACIMAWIVSQRLRTLHLRIFGFRFPHRTVNSRMNSWILSYSLEPYGKCCQSYGGTDTSQQWLPRLHGHLTWSRLKHY